MIRTLRASCLAALVAVAPFAHAEIARADAESLVRKSGLWEQLRDVGAQVDAGMQQALVQGTKAAPTESARVAGAIRSAYDAARLRAITTGTIAARLPPEHLQALLAWYDSAPGQAVSRAEAAAFGGKGDMRTELQEGAALLKGLPLERRTVLQDLLAATRAVEYTTQITIGTTIAVQLGVASAMPQAPAPSATQLRAMLEAQREQLARGFGAMVLASFARGYATVPVAHLRDYVAFLRTPAGAAFNDVSLQALDAALTDAATQLGRLLPGTRDRSNT